MPAAPPFVSALVVFSLLAAGSAAAASEREPPTLDPTTYASPSGEWELHVDPSEAHGAGPGDYRLTRGGEEVWAATRPFTFWEAAVTDAGAVVGYGYTSGWRGWFGEGDGEFVVAAFAPDGSPRLTDRTPRTPSRFFHTPPNPLAEGLFVQPERDRFVVRLANPDLNEPGERWLPFRLSDGAKLPEVRPNEWIGDREGRWSAMRVRPMGGTPLLLVHWYVVAEPHERNLRMGGAFTLTDAAGAVVWSLELPGDYEPAAGADRWERRDQVSRYGAILEVGPARFAVWSVAAGQRVDYAVAEAEDRWTVKEVARTPYDGSREDRPLSAADLEPIELAHLNMIVLGTKAAPPDGKVLTEIVALAAGFDGNLYAVDAPTASVHVFNREGTLLRVMNSLPKDFRPLYAATLAVAPDGSVYLDGEPTGEADGPNQFVCFAPTGGNIFAGV